MNCAVFEPTKHQGAGIWLVLRIILDDFSAGDDVGDVFFADAFGNGHEALGSGHEIASQGKRELRAGDFTRSSLGMLLRESCGAAFRWGVVSGIKMGGIRYPPDRRSFLIAGGL